MFCKYLETTGFNADPVLLAHEPNKDNTKILNKYTKIRAEYEFTTTNKSLHKLWIVDNTDDVKNIITAFDKIENIYIADGHHRCASSALLSKNKNSNLSSYFMSYLIDENQLNILNFNRLVKHLNGLNTSQFLSQIRLNYTVIEKNKNTYSPTFENEISMYLDGLWYSLIAIKKKYNSTTESLDPTILSKKILNPILDIVDERTDKNISFLDGTIPLLKIKEKIDNGEYSCCIHTKTNLYKAIKKVADNNEFMPPKSTYVEPKLRSGLTIYPIE